MKIYAISDLHLSVGVDKPMDIFGDTWANYMGKICDNWKNTIKNEDVVVIPGDICWAMYLEEALPDFKMLEDLPGKKIILKGNHDYWWITVNKLNQFILKYQFKTLQFLYNTSYICGNTVICGTRGWICPGDGYFTAEDRKVYNRELQRLRLSLDSIADKEEKEIIVALHYPPFGQKKQGSEFISILKEYNVKTCVYGHLHSTGTQAAITGDIDGTKYFLVSADYINFQPIFLTDYK